MSRKQRWFQWIGVFFAFAVSYGVVGMASPERPTGFVPSHEERCTPLQPQQLLPEGAASSVSASEESIQEDMAFELSSEGHEPPLALRRYSSDPEKTTAPPLLAAGPSGEGGRPGGGAEQDSQLISLQLRLVARDESSQLTPRAPGWQDLGTHRVSPELSGRDLLCELISAFSDQLDRIPSFAVLLGYEGPDGGSQADTLHLHLTLAEQLASLSSGGASQHGNIILWIVVKPTEPSAAVHQVQPSRQLTARPFLFEMNDWMRRTLRFPFPPNSK